MHLHDLPIGIEEFGLHLDLALEILEIARDTLLVPSDDLVAATVVAKRAAERDVHVDRQWGAGGVARPCVVAVFRFPDVFVKLQGRGIRRVPGAASAIAAYQVRVETRRGRLYRAVHGPNARRYEPGPEWVFALIPGA